MLDHTKPSAPTCACGRILQATAHYCDACGQGVDDMAAPRHVGSEAAAMQMPPLAGHSILAAVAARMQVQAADGTVLGRITGVGIEGDETVVEVTPARSLAVWLRLSHPAVCLYLPGCVVTAVAGRRALLRMDAQLARRCILRPSWFAGPTTANLHAW